LPWRTSKSCQTFQNALLVFGSQNWLACAYTPRARSISPSYR
jgi:hypothetical protein